MNNPIDRFTQAIETASIGEAGVFAPDAVLDATVPHWRYAVTGATNIQAELGRWYADPGRFEEMRRTPLPDGELDSRAPSSARTGRRRTRCPAAASSEW